MTPMNIDENMSDGKNETTSILQSLGRKLLVRGKKVAKPGVQIDINLERPKSLGKIRSVPGRLEKIGHLKNNSIVILDYAHTPDALEVCLKNIHEQFKLRKINLVFGCGGERDKPKRKIMGKIANNYCDKIFLTDDNPRYENPKKIRNQIKKKYPDLN